TAARIFVDNVGTRAGVAVANPGSQEAGVAFTLMDRTGAILAATSRRLSAGTQLPIFANELFPDLSDDFSGLLEIRSTVAVALLTLKLTINSRNDLVLTTLPVADLSLTSPPVPIVFPQIAIGSGYSTRLVLINRDANRAANGRLNFLQFDGGRMI